MKNIFYKIKLTLYYIFYNAWWKQVLPFLFRRYQLLQGSLALLKTELEPLNFQKKVPFTTLR